MEEQLVYIQKAGRSVLSFPTTNKLYANKAKDKELGPLAHLVRAAHS